MRVGLAERKAEEGKCSKLRNMQYIRNFSGGGLTLQKLAKGWIPGGHTFAALSIKMQCVRNTLKSSLALRRKATTDLWRVLPAWSIGMQGMTWWSFQSVCVCVVCVCVRVCVCVCVCMCVCDVEGV
jgi:hypothetical protein